MLPNLYAGGADPYSSIAAQNLSLDKLGLESQGQYYGQSAQAAQIALASQKQQNDQAMAAASMANQNAVTAQQAAMAQRSEQDTTNEKAANILLGLKQLAQSGQLTQQQLDLQKRQLDLQTGGISNTGPVMADNLDNAYAPVKTAQQGVAAAQAEVGRVMQLVAQNGLAVDRFGNIGPARGTALTDQQKKIAATAGAQLQQAKSSLAVSQSSLAERMRDFNMAHQEAMRGGYVYNTKDGTTTNVTTGKTFSPSGVPVVQPAGTDAALPPPTATASPSAGGTDVAPPTATMSPSANEGGLPPGLSGLVSGIGHAIGSGVSALEFPSSTPQTPSPPPVDFSRSPTIRLTTPPPAPQMLSNENDINAYMAQLAAQGKGSDFDSAGIDANPKTVRFQRSDGSVLDIPTEDLSHWQQVDPQGQVVQ